MEFNIDRPPPPKKKKNPRYATGVLSRWRHLLARPPMKSSHAYMAQNRDDDFKRRKNPITRTYIIACVEIERIITNNNNNKHHSAAAAAPVTVWLRIPRPSGIRTDVVPAAAVRVSVPIGRPRRYRYRVVVVVVEAGRYLRA